MLRFAMPHFTCKAPINIIHVYKKEGDKTGMDVAIVSFTLNCNALHKLLHAWTSFNALCIIITKSV